MEVLFGEPASYILGCGENSNYYATRGEMAALTLSGQAIVSHRWNRSPELNEMAPSFG